MSIELATKSPGYVNEFIGMYLVLGFIFGQFSCILAFPVYLLAYFKASGKRAHWIAVAASIVAIGGVRLYFYMLNH